MRPRDIYVEEDRKKANLRAEIDRLTAEVATLRAALERLGSSEALTHSHTIPATITGDELRARI